MEIQGLGIQYEYFLSPKAVEKSKKLFPWEILPWEVCFSKEESGWLESNIFWSVLSSECQISRAGSILTWYSTAFYARTLP